MDTPRHYMKRGELTTACGFESYEVSRTTADLWDATCTRCLERCARTIARQVAAEDEKEP